MEQREIGKTGLKVSQISLGCWTLGGLNWVNGVPNGWDNVDEKEAAEAVLYAVDNGVNHFDNADVYGNGRAERMIARILGKRNKEVTIATKVGWFPGTAEHAYEPQHIRHQCEQSLINLNRDYIDLYYFHHGDFGENDEYLDDAVAELNKLKEEGKIRFIGQSAYTHKDFTRLVPKVKPDALQSFANAIDNKFIADGSPTRKVMEEYNASFVAFGPIEKGVLLGKYTSDNLPEFKEGDHRKNSKTMQPEFIKKIEPKIEKLKEQFGERPEDLVRAALQYLLHYNIVSAVIPGFRNMRQVKTNLSAADKPLTDDEFKFIDDLFKNIEK